MGSGYSTIAISVWKSTKIKFFFLKSSSQLELFFASLNNLSASWKFSYLRSGFINETTTDTNEIKQHLYEFLTCSSYQWRIVHHARQNILPLYEVNSFETWYPFENSPYSQLICEPSEIYISFVILGRTFYIGIGASQILQNSKLVASRHRGAYRKRKFFFFFQKYFSKPWKWRIR